MTTLNSRLQLAILNRKKGRNMVEKGFTLVELMIVIIIVGILSAVALPNLLGQRDRAAAQSLIGGMNAFAGQCQSNILSENPTPMAGVLNNPNMTVTGLLGAAADQCGTVDLATGIFTAADAGAAFVTYANTTAFPNPDRLQGLRCGVDANGVVQLADGATDARCTFTVDNGVVTGEWSS